MNPETRRKAVTAAYDNTFLRIPPEFSHALAKTMLRFPPAQVLIRKEFSPPPEPEMVLINGHQVPKFQIAAGLDKSASMPALILFGAGGIEFGGVTLDARSGNSRIERVEIGSQKRLTGRIIRFPEQRVVLNHMGFPNPGIFAVAQNILQAKEKFPNLKFGINIPPAPNEPDLEEIKRQLTLVTEVALALSPFWITFNPSCPNNKDSQRFKKVDIVTQLTAHLGELASRESSPPFFVKIGPDMDKDGIKQVVTAVKDNHFSGIIAVNTTTDYTGPRQEFAGYPGGLSGNPLKEKMLRTVSLVNECNKASSPRLFIGAAGGISCFQDWQQAQEKGAHFCQILTGFIYNPYVFKQLNT